MSPEYDEEDRRRVRGAIFGGAPLTRPDAELLAQRFPYNGSRASRLFSIFAPLAIVYFAVLAGLGVAHHASVGRLVVPIAFVVFAVLALFQRLRIIRKIQRALAA